MIDEKEYKRLKQAAEKAKTDHDRAVGQLDSAMARLLDEFECATVAEADSLLKKLDKKATKAETEYETAKIKFDEDWKGQLQ